MASQKETMARKKIRERMRSSQILAADQIVAPAKLRVLPLRDRGAAWKATAQASWRREQTGEHDHGPQTQHEMELKTRHDKFKEQTSLPLLPGGGKRVIHVPCRLSVNNCAWLVKPRK
jgi:hypothetical protein